MDDALRKGRISKQDWTLLAFFIAMGPRPVQVARMRKSDVIVTGGPEGKEVTVQIPLAKAEGQVTKARWKFRAPTLLAEALLAYLELPDIKARSDDDPLFEATSAEISARFRSALNGVDTYSRRLGGPIPLVPYRFRYTVGTRAIEHGATDHQVARLLTHRTTHCIAYYRASLPSLQRPIREAIADEMDFFAGAFQGRAIRSLGEATRAGDPTAAIRDFANLVGRPLGACGTRARCHQDAPRACLTCPKFEPLLEAPWEQLLQALQEDLGTESEPRIREITKEQMPPWRKSSQRGMRP